MRRDRRPPPAGGCVAAQRWVPTLAGGDGAADLPRAVSAHVGGCLPCQADVARYRRMVRDLRSLQGQRLVPPDDALSRTLSALRSLEPRRPVAYVASIGGMVATAAGAAAGVLVWRSRRRAMAG